MTLRKLANAIMDRVVFPVVGYLLDHQALLGAFLMLVLLSPLAGWYLWLTQCG